MANDLALKLSKRVKSIKPSPTLAVSARADEMLANGKPILNLSVGEPDFDTPDYIKIAAILAIQAGHTKYTAVDGIKSLKGAVCDKFSRENNLSFDLNQVIVSCGAKHSLYNLFSSILNEQDEVIIFAPFWVSYPDIVKLTGGEPVIIKTDFTNAFKPTPESLRAAITPKTRAVILNSPCNPTGMCYTNNELQKLAEVLIDYPQILIVSDDIYEHMLWSSDTFSNIVNVCPELYDRTIIVNGVAKTYAMTGWRIGYAAGPRPIIAAMKKIQSQSTSNPTSIAQYAALAALNGDQQSVKEMLAAYQKRHDFLINALSQLPGFSCLPSQGTFYSFPSISQLLHQRSGIEDDIQFSEYLLEKAGIAVVPGSAFGAPGHIRISFATNIDRLEEGVERLQETLTNFS